MLSRSKHHAYFAYRILQVRLLQRANTAPFSERNRLAGFEAKFRNNYRATRGAWGDLFYAKIRLYILRNYRLGATYHKQTLLEYKTTVDFSDSLTALSLVYLLAALEPGPSLSFLQSYSAYGYSAGFWPLFLPRWTSIKKSSRAGKNKSEKSGLYA